MGVILGTAEMQHQEATCEALAWRQGGTPACLSSLLKASTREEGQQRPTGGLLLLREEGAWMAQGSGPGLHKSHPQCILLPPLDTRDVHRPRTVVSGGEISPNLVI